MVSVEQYPNLKANENFLKLQDELASTENQILQLELVLTNLLNLTTIYFNNFPRNIFWNYGLKEKPYFKAVAGADKPVEVKFNFPNQRSLKK